MNMETNNSPKVCPTILSIVGSSLFILPPWHNTTFYSLKEDNT